MGPVEDKKGMMRRHSCVIDGKNEHLKEGSPVRVPRPCLTGPKVT